MNRSIEILKELYKPYRYTIKGNATILETTSGNYVIKQKGKDIKKLFSYLENRNFDNFPFLIDESRKDVNVYEYIENKYEPLSQKYEDLINLVASLHNKTSYFKEVNKDKYKEIYENINNNLNYLKNHYENLYNEKFKEIYTSPSNYLFLRNYSKIQSAIEFSLNELNKWLGLVKDEEKIRVVLLHNNLKVDHFIKNNKDYLISWDKYKFDTPIIDIVNLYKNEYLNTNFENILKKYFNLFPLLNHEKKLLFLLLAIPPELKLHGSEFQKCETMSNFLNYIYKTEKLIRPYYSDKKEKE